jgi:hypothetical protein
MKSGYELPRAARYYHTIILPSSTTLAQIIPHVAKAAQLDHDELVCTRYISLLI